MSAGAIYLDASALVKLVEREAESDALVAFLEPRAAQFTSRVSAVEVPRAVARRAGGHGERLRQVLRQPSYLELDEPVVERAVALEPPSLRALDAIHLASALELGEDLGAFVTYDDRLAEAARAAGLEVVAPA